MTGRARRHPDASPFTVRRPSVRDHDAARRSYRQGRRDAMTGRRGGRRTDAGSSRIAPSRPPCSSTFFRVRPSSCWETSPGCTCPPARRLSALALLLPQASKAQGRAQAVLSLGSAPRGDIIDRDEDALPLPVGVSKAGEAICDQRPAGRTLGGTIGRERGAHRLVAGGGACILPRYALTPLGSRPPRPWGSVSMFRATGVPSHSAKSVWSATASSVSGWTSTSSPARCTIR